jgi:large subunit ribosomal protein L2
MGKNLIQQRRGRGLGRYTSPSHRYRGRPNYSYIPKASEKGVVVDIMDAPGRSTPLAVVDFDGKKILQIPHEGAFVGQEINLDKAEAGNILALSKISEGSKVFNIELYPGDGGKLCRSSGSFATVISREHGRVVVEMPSKEKKVLSARCLATVGSAAGAGRIEKPFLKAGYKYHSMHAAGRRYPRVRGVAMNAVDHPFGGSTKPGKHKSVSRHKPPGAKVGSISPRRTGKKKK